MTKTLLSAAAGIALLVVAAATQAQDSSPDPLRDKAARLEEKARALKQEGRHDEAAKLMREVEELRGQREKMDRQHGPGPDSGPDNRNAERREIERKLDQTRAKMSQQRATGNEAEVRELERHVDELERRLDELRRQNGPQPERAEYGTRQGGREPGPEGSPEQRQHVREAIEHLHAAGLHDVAVKLQQMAAERWPEFRPDQGRGGPQPGPKGQFQDQMNRRFEEVLQTLRKLNERLERLERLERQPRGEP